MQKEPIFSLIDLLTSAAASEIRNQLDRAAANDLPVLLYGETGSGKDVWAAYLHASMGCGPFISLHCADIPDTLIESQWFGYKQGAFTGAVHDHPGRWLGAQNGVLYLNRIDLLKTEIQSKLLRVIERKRFYPLGAMEETSIETRFVFSTGADILDLVESGQFRPDLYYRVSTFSIRIPPLRERREDIIPLLEYFSQLHGVELRLGPNGRQTLLTHTWPGNIRELENLAQRCAISHGVISDEGLAANIGAMPFEKAVQLQELSLKELEHRYIRHLLKRYRNKAQVARILGISRKTLYNKMKDHGKD